MADPSGGTVPLGLLSRNRERLRLVVLALLVGLGLCLGVYLGWRSRGPLASSTLAGHGATDHPNRPATPAAPPDALVFAPTGERPATTPPLIQAGLDRAYLFYELPTDAANLPVSVGWSRNGQPIGSVPGGDITPDAAAPGHGLALLRPPGGILLPGLYEAEVNGGAHRLVATFQVAWGAEQIMGQQAPAAVEAEIADVAFAAGVSPDGSPLKLLRRIPRDTRRVYFVVRFDKAEPGTALTIKWFLDGEELTAASREVGLQSSAGWVNAWVEASPFLPGSDCRAVAYLAGDDVELASVTATVAGDPPPVRGTSVP